MQQESRLAVCEGQPGDKVSVPQPGRLIAWDLSNQETTECLRASRMCKTSGGTDTDLASLGEEEDGGSVKLKKPLQLVGTRTQRERVQRFATWSG